MSAHLKTLARRLCPDVIPIFPLGGAILLPGCEMPLNIFEPRYLNMIDDVLRADRLIGIVQNAVDPVKAAPRHDGQSQLAPVGGLGRIKQFSETDDGRYIIALTGLKRFTIVSDADAQTPYRQARISFDEYASDIDTHSTAILPKAMSEDAGERAKMTGIMKVYAKSLGVQVDWDALSLVPMKSLIDQTCMISPFNPFDKQSLLEAPDHDARRRLLNGLMTLYSTTGDGSSTSKDLQ